VVAPSPADMQANTQLDPTPYAWYGMVYIHIYWAAMLKFALHARRGRRGFGVNLLPGQDLWAWEAAVNIRQAINAGCDSGLYKQAALKR